MKKSDEFDKWFEDCFGTPRVSRLHQAAETGDCKTLRQLLADGDSPNKEFMGRTPLVAAAERGQLLAVKELLKAGANPNEALVRAVFLRNREIINELINGGADVNRVEGGDASILAYVSLYGYADMVGLLIEAGANVNQTGNTSSVAEDTVAEMTPLMLASMEGQFSVVKLLLAKGADINCRDKNGHTALDWARKKRTKKHARVAELLERKGGTTQQPVEQQEQPEPDFEAAAKEPNFLAAVRLVKKLTRKRARKLTNSDGIITGAVAFSLPAQDAKQLVAQLQPELLKQGCYLLHTCDTLEDEAGDGVAIFPTTNIFDILTALQTEGPNSDVYNRDLINWLRNLAEPLQITGAGSDFLAGKFTAAINDPDVMARKILELCPEGDIGDNAAGDLAERLKANRELFLWWD